MKKSASGVLSLSIGKSNLQPVGTGDLSTQKDPFRRAAKGSPYPLLLTEQFEIFASICFESPGHQTLLLASALHLTIPW